MTNTQPTLPTTVALAQGTLTVQSSGPGPYPPTALIDFASRKNPKRAFLFVSKVLGKHIPTRPQVMAITHAALNKKLAAFVGNSSKLVVLGFAETATGLGAGLFETMLRRNPNRQGSLLYIQTTRYRFDARIALEFKESHSHATDHIVYEPHSPLLRTAESLVMVDDELTTGNTCRNVLRQLLTINPNIKRVALASLVDWMHPAHRELFVTEFPTLEFEFVSLASGTFTYTPHSPDSQPVQPVAVTGNGEAKDHLVCQRGCARFGQQQALVVSPARLLAKLDPTQRVYVVGDGELMHVAFKVASKLVDAGFEATVQATTRSPAVVGQALTAALTFEDHYADGIVNFLYNPPAVGAQVVVLHETPNADALCAQLVGRVVVPCHVREVVCL